MLDGPHGIQFDSTPAFLQQARLESTDAVFGGEATTEGFHDRVDGMQVPI